MKAVLRHAFYKALGRALAPNEIHDDQLAAAMEVIAELSDLKLSNKVQRFFLVARRKPWMYDVFKLIQERKQKDAYEQRESKSASRRKGFEDPAAEFFDLVKGHDGI
jgi:TorA maturation chaperone TorD